MTPQTFRGRSLDEAKKTATRALGPSTVVLASRRLNKGGVFGLFSGTEFEVTATSRDIDLTPAPSSRRHPFAEAARLSTPIPPSGAEAIRNEVRAEIRALRALITSQKTEASTTAQTDTVGQELDELRQLVRELTMNQEAPATKKKKRLTALGIEGAAERAIARKLKGLRGEPTDAQLRDALADVVQASAWPLEDKGRTLICLVGPTGVGKTTTAAKLAARSIIDHDRTVTLISCDGYRVGAQEQMKRFAELLGAEFTAVRDRAELAKAIDAATTDVVIVDTAGRGPAEPDGIEAALPRIKTKTAFTRHTLLCVPAALRDVDARSIAKYFAACKPTALAVTKLDETTSPVGLVHAAAAAKLGVAVTCFGQRVPDDIAPASADKMIDALLASCPPAGREASARLS